MKNKAFVIVAVLIAIVCIIPIVYKTSQETSAVEEYDLQNLINNYISYIGGDFENADKIFCNHPGMEASEDLLPDTFLEDAEQNGLLDEKQQYSERLLTQARYAAAQNALVKEQFGDDAWETVKYELVEEEPIDGALGYKVVETGELVDEKTYQLMNREYWTQIAESEGIGYYDIFLTSDEGPEAMENKRVALIDRYIDKEPVKAVRITEKQRFSVNLSFNNKTESESGLYNFHFYVEGSEKNGWEIRQGLSWSEKFPEYPEDDL